MTDALLTALVEAFAAWTGRRVLLVNLERHGREDILDGVDLSRTVGWFTSLYPVLLDLEEETDPGRSLRSIKEQLRQIPNHGIGYGLLRYLRDETEVSAKLAALPRPELSFLYEHLKSETFGWKIINTELFGGLS